MAILLFVVGLVFLIVGAEALVRGASRLAAVFGISPLVIGLTVVAFGTSSPELAVSVKSAFSGQASIAVGNVVGSNIFNVLFILGLSAMIVPLAVSQQLVRLDVPLMIALSILVLVLALDEHLSRVNGLLLVAILVAYLSFLIYQGRRQSTGAAEEYSRGSGTGGPPKANRKSDRVKDISQVMGGLALLVLATSQHDALPGINVAMLCFVIPLTVLFLMISALREIRRRKTALPE